MLVVRKEKSFEAIFFDLDDTLFSSTLMSSTARRNAIRAIREAGVELDEESTYELLLRIVKKYGSNYNEHFNRLLEELGFESHPKLIAAAIVAYHNTKLSLLRPFPGVILTLLTLVKEVKIGLISDGIKIKQWEKLTYLGIQHFFDVVVINDTPKTWKPARYGYKEALEKLKIENPENTIYVGNKIETDIIGANRMNMFSILMNPNKKPIPKNLTSEEKPDLVITHIQQILDLVKIKPIRWRF